MIYVVVTIMAGLLMDLAAFERLRLYLAGIWATSDEFRYRRLLLPRLVVTIIASGIVGFGVYRQQALWAIGGGVLFVASLAYAAYLILSTEFY